MLKLAAGRCNLKSCERVFIVLRTHANDYRCEELARAAISSELAPNENYEISCYICWNIIVGMNINAACGDLSRSNDWNHADIAVYRF